MGMLYPLVNISLACVGSFTLLRSVGTRHARESLVVRLIGDLTRLHQIENMWKR
jgi:hypothetical protein